MAAAVIAGRKVRLRVLAAEQVPRFGAGANRDPAKLNASIFGLWRHVFFSEAQNFYSCTKGKVFFSKLLSFAGTRITFRVLNIFLAFECVVKPCAWAYYY